MGGRFGRDVWLGALAVALLLGGCSSTSPYDNEGDFTIASFNIHYLAVGRDVMPWDERKDAVRDVLEELDADLIAFQEMETFGGGQMSTENIQLDFLLEALPHYEAAAVGDPERYPSTQPILYRADRFVAVEQGFFFFSSTPDVIYSRPWHARFPAFCSWVLFEHHATGERFYVYNVHFDASSARNRVKSASLTLDRIEGRSSDAAALVVGDFNAPLLFPTMRRFLRAGFDHSGIRRATYHFNRGLNLIPGIDHILHSDGLETFKGHIERGDRDGVYPSDHYPVMTAVTFETGVSSGSGRSPREQEESR
ncbi:MAG: endonuclease/exonuclease/phosphatase family protein [Spirochaetales bacterium]